MHEHASFVGDLALVLMVAALTGMLFRALKQPAVLGYLLAGLLVGPYVPIPIFADAGRVEALSEFGVVLVMFVVGLELRLSRLARVLPVSGLTGVVQISALMWMGFSLARLLGWGTVEGLFLGGCLAISSTMVVSKIFDQVPVSGPVREHVFGVLVIQDVAAVGLITALTAVAHGEGLSAAAMVRTVGGLLGALVGMVVVGLFVVPRLIRATVKLESPESLAVMVMGVCFGFALLAEVMGYSVALGAFVAGVLVAESGEGSRVEHLMQPMRDVFAAVFFVSVGMVIDPHLVWAHLGVSLLVVACVIFGQLFSVTIAGILSGNGLRRAVVGGLALGQIGEFAFVIAAIGVGAGVVRPALQPIVVTVAAITAFTTPLLLRARESILHRLDAWMPHRLQTLISLYEAWFEDVRRSERQGPGPLRRAIRAVALDGLGMIGLLLASQYGFDAALSALRDRGLSEAIAVALLLGVLVLLLGALAVGLLRNTRALGDALAEGALSGQTAKERGASMERATRWLLKSAAPLIVLVGVGLPFAAVARPFFGAPYVVVVLLLFALGLGSFVWRAANAVDAEVRSSAGRLLTLIARQRAPENAEAHGESPPSLTQHIVSVTLDEGAPSVGQTLVGLDLRAQTGATVVAIRRVGVGEVLPTGHDPLRSGDLLAVVGSDAAIERARVCLLEPPPS